ncbi:hypothetical protein GCM10009000_068070 [Halobacterium noricense]
MHHSSQKITYWILPTILKASINKSREGILGENPRQFVHSPMIVLREIISVAIVPFAVGGKDTKLNTK